MNACRGPALMEGLIEAVVGRSTSGVRLTLRTYVGLTTVGGAAGQLVRAPGGGWLRVYAAQVSVVRSWVVRLIVETQNGFLVFSVEALAVFFGFVVSVLFPDA